MLKLIFSLSLFLSITTHAINAEDEALVPNSHGDAASLYDLGTKLCLLGGIVYLGNTITLGKALSTGVLELCQQLGPDKICSEAMNALPYLPGCISVASGVAATAWIAAYCYHNYRQELCEEDAEELP